MILEAVQVNRYKNGLFVTSITPHTDLMHDINILIASTQVTGLDNLRVQNVKAGVEEIKRRRASGHRISTTVMGRRMTIYDFYGQHVSELRVSTPRKLFRYFFGSGYCFRRVHDHFVFTDMVDYTDLGVIRMFFSPAIDASMHAGWNIMVAVGPMPMMVTMVTLVAVVAPLPDCS